MQYSPQLDGLRWVCILFTVLNHIGPHPAWLNGTVGVDIFFALSGYLITRLLITETLAHGKPCLGCFYLRRFFRIVPVCYAAFALYAIATLARPEKYQELTAVWPYVLTFMSEYRPAEAGTIFGHAWTLGIEEKYYLLWPLMFIGLQRLRHDRQVALLLVLLGAELLFLPTMELRGYGGLTLGSLMAIVSTRNPSLVKIPAGAAVAAVIAAYGLTLIVEGGHVHVLLAAASCLLIVNVSQPSFAARFLSWSPLAKAGRHTYAVYLIHVLVANAVAWAPHWLLRFALTISLSLVVAALMKRTLEDPMIALGRRLASQLQARTRSLHAA